MHLIHVYFLINYYLNSKVLTDNLQVDLFASDHLFPGMLNNCLLFNDFFIKIVKDPFLLSNVITCVRC